MKRTRRFATSIVMGALVLVMSACMPSPLVIIDTVAGTGTRGFSGDGGSATDAEIHRPFGVAVDASGNLYIADTFNNRVRKVDSQGIITTVAGTGTTGFSGDGSAATSAQLYQPVAVAVDGAGSLFIADLGNLRIRKVDTLGVITTVAGTGSPGYSGDGGPAIDANLNYPQDVSVDGSGNLYIADSSNHRVRKVDTLGDITTVAGTGVQGFSGDGGAATDAELNSPRGIEVDALGNLFIADSSNHRVRKVDASGVITTFAGSGVGAFYGDGGPATSAGLNRPRGLALLPGGTLVIADLSNNGVRVVYADGTIATLAGFASAPSWPPSSGYAGDGDVPTKAVFDFPQSVAYDGKGAIYIADERNSRVRKIYAGGGAIGGRVVDESEGTAISGLTVNLYAASDLVTPVATTTTGFNGWYGFSVLTGDYLVEVEAGGGYLGEWFANAPQGSSATTIVVAAGDQDRADITLGK